MACRLFVTPCSLRTPPRGMNCPIGASGRASGARWRPSRNWNWNQTRTGTCSRPESRGARRDNAPRRGQEEAHRSRPPAGGHQQSLRPGEVHPSRPPEHPASVVGAATLGGGAGGHFRADGHALDRLSSRRGSIMAEVTSFFAHGSRWVRADFHLHTRLDREFKDTGTEQDFVTRYVAALKEADIHVGVITNHNKFDREEFKAIRRAAKRESIYLIPGVELSVKDGRNGIHTLVAFHDDWVDNQENKDHINTFLGLTFAGQAGYENSNARSNHDLQQTLRELDKFEKDYLLIFAHVEEENGLWSALDGGRITELGENELFRSRTAAFQKVRTRDTREKVKGWLGGWYPSEVEGSDPKAIIEIGRGDPTFIKIGAFTFEAVQFALKPGAERLSGKAVPRQVHSWVRSLRFEGGILDGKRVDLSEEMNCLIGIRGSGKSAILESLRCALAV